MGASLLKLRIILHIVIPISTEQSKSIIHLVPFKMSHSITRFKIIYYLTISQILLFKSSSFNFHFINYYSIRLAAKMRKKAISVKYTLKVHSPISRLGVSKFPTRFRQCQVICKSRFVRLERFADLTFF